MRRDAECVQPDAVARGFVVETEFLAGVPDFAQTFFESNPARLACADLRQRPLLLVGRLQRIAREQMLRIREDELLVLLLVMQAQFDQGAGLCGKAVGGEQAEQGLVHMTAIREHFFETRARQEAPLRPRVAIADAVVVGVEQDPVLRRESSVTRLVRNQDESLEEPRRVREMPFHRTRVGHRLDRAILHRKRRGERARRAANREVCFAPLPARIGARGGVSRIGNRVHGTRPPQGGMQRSAGGRPSAVQGVNSLDVIVYFKLSGSRLSSRPCAVSAWGYMKKVSLPPFELGRAKSFAVLNASQFISQAPKSMGLTACTSRSLKVVGCAFSSSTTFLTSAGSTGTQPNPAR